VHSAAGDIFSSAKLRDRLFAELSELGSSDDAATCGHRCLAEENKLIAADANASRRHLLDGSRLSPQAAMG
jgi:hypothetical protein